MEKEKTPTKIKCGYGHCEHKGENEVWSNDKTPRFLGDEFHEEGLCWKITQESFKDHPTNIKYCPCAAQPDLIRRYDRVGYMERDEYDKMITRKCSTCSKTGLFSIHERQCITCKTQNYKEPVEEKTQSYAQYAAEYDGPQNSSQP